MSAAQLMYQHLCRALRANYPLSSLAVLYWLAAHPGEHDRMEIHRAIFRGPNTRQFDWMVKRLIDGGLVTQRLARGEKSASKYVHAITPAGMKWLRLKEDVTTP